MTQRTTSTRLTCLDSNISYHAQDVTLTEFWHLRSWNGEDRNRIGAPKPDRLRLTIRSNAYKDQSHATIEVWRDRWVELWTLTGTTMTTKHSLYGGLNPNDRHGKFVNEAEFDADRATLLEKAEQVL